MKERLTARLIVDCTNELGEGVQWNPRDKRVYWTDILGKYLWSCDAEGGGAVSLAMPARLCSFAFTDADWILAAFEDGVYEFELPSASRRLIALYPTGNGKRIRMNDGGTDRQGRFVVGGIEEDGLAPLTPVWIVDNGKVRRVIEGVGCANSIAFSPRGDRMYFADTANRDIFAFDYDRESGTPSNRHVFTQLADDEGNPDGSCVDAEGGLWNAQFGGGGVQRYRADGGRDLRVDLPAPNVTCCAFGGPDLTRLFITTARVGLQNAELESYPLSGGLFAVDLPITGIEAVRYRT